jgi:hypothetical protein
MLSGKNIDKKMSSEEQLFLLFCLTVEFSTQNRFIEKVTIIASRHRDKSDDPNMMCIPSKTVSIF